MSVTIPLDIFSRLDASIQTAILAAIKGTASESASSTVKKPRVNKGQSTSHGDFTKKILEEHKAEVDAFKAELKISKPEQKGAHLVFVSKYKKEHVEEFKAFEAEWKAAHPKVFADDSASSSDEVSPAAGGMPAAAGKPKRVMSDEQKAKMKAGREKAAAAKKALSQGVNDALGEMAAALEVPAPRAASPKMKPE